VNCDPATPDPALSSAPFKIYNLGNNRAERLNDFIAILEDALGRRAEKRYLPFQQGDVPATEADIGDTVRDLGWRPSTELREGLGRFARWFRQYYG
jgi:UDP-glucuronate 4-epimerase